MNSHESFLLQSGIVKSSQALIEIIDNFIKFTA